MEKYFELVLDLLEIEEDKEELMLLAESLVNEEAAGNDIYFAYRYHFLFNAYLALVRWEIEPEEFVQIGDTLETFPIYHAKEDTTKACLERIQQWNYPKETVIVLDENMWNHLLDQDEQKQVLDLLKKENKKLFLGK